MLVVVQYNVVICRFDYKPARKQEQKKGTLLVVYKKKRKMAFDLILRYEAESYENSKERKDLETRVM